MSWGHAKGQKGLCCSGPAAFDTDSPKSPVSAAVALHLPSTLPAVCPALAHSPGRGAPEASDNS